MPSSGMLHRVALVRTDVSEELSSSSLLMEALSSSETSRNISEGNILNSHRGENLKSYIALTGWAL
jgi:hypothetical protein